MNVTTMKTLFSSNTDEWRTPPKLYNKLHTEFKFTLDAAATPESTLCTTFYSKDNCGLTNSWKGHTVFCNPPYSRKLQDKFIRKAYHEAIENRVISVLLIPARTCKISWHEVCMQADELRFIKGRLKFSNQDGTTANSAPFPSVLVIFNSVYNLCGFTPLTSSYII